MAANHNLNVCLLTYIYILCIFVTHCNGQDNKTKIDQSLVDKPKSVKKELTLDHVENSNVLPGDQTQTHNHSIDGGSGDVVVIEEKPRQVENIPATSSKPATLNVSTISSQVLVEETNFKHKFFESDENDDMSDSFQTTFYFFVGLSSVAVLFIIVRLYRLRLSRAERKYGVQGDRTTQELTPLPISIEDGNSDDDDQTLFEINRPQIRIL